MIKKALLCGLSVAVILLGHAATVTRAQGNSPQACPGSLESRLVASGLGRSLDTILNVAYEPASTQVQSGLPAGGVFRVIHGPVCRANSAWWEIHYTDVDGKETTGWISEGDGNQYAVEPLPKVDMTYIAPDGSITFQYPHEYQILVDTADAVMLSNQASANIQPGQLILAVYKSAQVVPSLRGAQGTPAQLMDQELSKAFIQGILYAPPITVNLGGQTAVYTYTSGRASSSDSLIIIVDKGNGESAVLVGMTSPGEVQDFLAPAMSIAQSLTISDPSGVSASLDHSFTLDDGSFSMQYRGGWLVEPVDNTVVIVNSPSVYQIADLDSLKPGQLLVFIFPTVADIPNYAGDPSGYNNPANVLASEVESAMEVGYTPDGAVSAVTVGDRTGARWFAHGSAHEMLILTLDNGQGNVTTIEAYAAPGELLQYEPTLMAMMGTFEAK